MTDHMYPDGKWEYRAETRRWNPFVRTPQGGRVLSALKLPFFLLRTPHGYGVLVTTGAKTGRARRKCIRAIVDGDRTYLVSIGGGYAAWVKNIRHDPRVRLRLGRKWFDGVAAELSDPAELAAARDMYCRTVVPFDYPTCRVHRRGMPSRDKIVELTTAWLEGGIPVVIRLDRQRQRHS